MRSFDQELAQALRDNAAQAAQRAAEAADGAARQLRAGPDEEGEDGEAGEAADSAVQGQPFFTAALPPPEPIWRHLGLEQLLEFYRDPGAYLLQRRLQLELPRDEDELADDEPFLASVPARTALARRLLPGLLAGSLDREQALALARAGTEWPEGSMGLGGIEAELAAMELFCGTVRAITAGEVEPAWHHRLDLRIEQEDWRLEGGFADLRANRRVRWRYDDERGRDVLQAWIEHLFLCAAPPAGVQPVTCCVMRGGVRSFRALPPEQAIVHLQALVADYRQGLCEPLRFIPKPAWKRVTQSASAARNAWQGNDFAAGDKDKPAGRLAFRGDPDPLDARFEAQARALFEPALAASQLRPLGAEGAA